MRPLAGTKLVVAVSGGVDSMVLLHQLSRAVPDPPKTLLVCHFDHRLRGEASTADRLLVEATAKSLGLGYRAGFPSKPPAESGTSLEVWARRERLAFLQRCARSINARFIITGHTLDDQLELFFLRLFRGEASSLGGMRERDPFPFDPALTLLRPWVSVPKTELLAEAERSGIPHQEDASNADPSFRRNWVRHRLLPFILEEYGPGLGATVHRVSEILAEESAHLDSEAARWLAQPERLGRMAFDQLPVALQRRILWRQFRDASVVPVFEAIERLRSAPGMTVTLEGGFQARLKPDGRLELLRHKTPAPSVPASPRSVDLAECRETSFDGVRFQWCFCWAKPIAHSRGRKKEQFDADAVGPGIVLRHWLPGDRFQPSGFSKAAKLQDLFVSAKIPRAARHRLIVACRRDGEIFWVEGLRIAERFKLGPETVRCLEWRWQRPEALLATHPGT